jgi:hypothetical protein
MTRAWVLAAALVFCTGAHAQSTGIVADRFVPALGPHTLFSVEGAAVTPFRRLSWALSLGWVSDPLKLVNQLTGDVVSRPVRGQLTTDLSVEAGLWRRRLAFAIGLPIVLSADGDRLAGVSADDRPLAGQRAGDFRMRLKAALLPNPDAYRMHLSAALVVTAPFGGQSDFAATDGATVELMLLADYLIGPIVLAADAGVRFAPQRTLIRTNFGDELDWRAGAAYGVFAWAGGFGALILEVGGQVGADPGTRPAELRGGVRAGLRGFTLDVGAGVGLDGDVGAPAWRVFTILRHALAFD